MKLVHDLILSRIGVLFIVLHKSLSFGPRFLLKHALSLSLCLKLVFPCVGFCENCSLVNVNSGRNVLCQQKVGHESESDGQVVPIALVVDQNQDSGLVVVPEPQIKEACRHLRDDEDPRFEVGRIACISIDDAEHAQSPTRKNTDQHACNDKANDRHVRKDALEEFLVICVGQLEHVEQVKQDHANENESDSA